ncbi:MAG: hypothetical protein ABJ242_05905 [Marinomonas sp.]
MTEKLIWTAIIGGLYLTTLFWIAVSNRIPDSFTRAEFYRSASRPVGAIFLTLTFAATLFSAWFVIGVPSFAHGNGIGVWPYVFLGDVLGVLVMYLVGRRFIELMYSGALAESPIKLLFADKVTRLGYLCIVAVLLLPYLALQILGAGSLVSAASEGILSPAIASGVVLLVIWVYSTISGIRGIVISDALQGSLIFIINVILGVSVVYWIGGLSGFLEQVRAVDPKLLDIPGPNNFFTFPVFLSFFVAVTLIPVSQPQFLTRYLLLFSDQTSQAEAKSNLARTCFGMGFAFSVVSLPILLTGLGGRVLFPDIETSDTLITQILTVYAPEFLFSVFVVAVVAAAMSTIDSILFSLAQMFAEEVTDSGAETPNPEAGSLLVGRMFVLVVASIAYGFSLMTSQAILYLGALAFSATLVVVPAILFGLFVNRDNAVWSRTLMFSPLMIYLLMKSSGWDRIAGFDASIVALLFGLVLFVVANGQKQAS